VSDISEYVTSENYLEAKIWFKEAIICRDRSWIIFISTCLANQNDFHGSIEALQHANELSLKSLYLLVGKDWKRGHNPAKDIDEVFEIYLKIFPALKNNEVMLEYIKWIKKHGKEMKKLHIHTMYGKSVSGKSIPPSKLFEEKDYSTWVHRTNNLIEVLKGFFMNIGKLLGVLNEDEEKELKILSERRHKISTDEKYREEMIKLVMDGLKI
jgi:HEPN domain-containing protein